MQKGTETNPLQIFLNLFRPFYSGKFWLWKSLVFIVLVSLFIQYPNYTYFGQQYAAYADHVPGVSQGNNFWTVLVMQRDQPLVQNHFYDCPQHEDVMAFRLALPLMAKLLHLDPKGMFILLNLFNVLLLGATLHVIKKQTGDKTLAFFTTLGLATIYLGCSGFIDALGLVVIIGYSMLMVSLASRNPLIIFLAIFVAAWSDERALLGSTFTFFWWLGVDNKFSFTSLREVNFTNIRSLSVIAAWIAYFAGRSYLTYVEGFNMTLGFQGVWIFFEMSNRLLLSLWSTFEGLWLVILTTLAVILMKKDWINVFFMFGGFLLLVLGGSINHDTTKSYSYLLLLLPISIVYLYHHFKRSDIRKLVIMASLVCIMTPTTYIINTVMPTSSLAQEALLFIKARYYDQIYSPEVIEKCLD